jgi:hypothetical protein
VDEVADCCNVTSPLILYKWCSEPTSARPNNTQAQVQERPTRGLHHWQHTRPQRSCGQENAAATEQTLLHSHVATTAGNTRWTAGCGNHKHQLPSLSQPLCKQLLAIRQLACKERPAIKQRVHVGNMYPCLLNPTASTCSLEVHAGVSGLCRVAAQQLQRLTQNNILLSLVKQAAHHSQAIARPGVTLTIPLAWPCHRRPAKLSNNKPHPNVPCAHPITTHARQMHTAAN